MHSRPFLTPYCPIRPGAIWPPADGGARFAVDFVIEKLVEESATTARFERVSDWLSTGNPEATDKSAVVQAARELRDLGRYVLVAHHPPLELRAFFLLKVWYPTTGPHSLPDEAAMRVFRAFEGLQARVYNLKISFGPRGRVDHYDYQRAHPLGFTPFEAEGLHHL